MVINRKLVPWLIAGVALATILLIVLVMVAQATPDSAPLHQEASISPGIISYQGQVNIGGVPFSGTGYFRFAIVDSGGTFYWSNDSSTITPTEAVTLTVTNGLFNALLGETNPITYGMFLDSDRWLRVWFDDGTHGVQLLEPDTRFTTAPFAFQADHAATAITATIFKTSIPNIVGDPYNGNSRGLGAVDMQLQRGLNVEVASGSYSVINGGVNNQAMGTGSTVLGGAFNSAWGNYCVASGFAAQSGFDAQAEPRFYDGVFIFGDSTNDEFNGITDNEFAIRARGGFRHAYNNSNWWRASVDNGGAVTFDSVGTTPGFTINDSLTVSGVFSATVLTVTYATTAGDAATALTATNATTATYATTALTATNATTATYAATALTATNATTATYATTALTATNATTATYATTALTATNATTATYATTALTATNATTATYATTALTATNATTATTAITSSQANDILFPATQIPSANVNSLDDYEEGTFTVAMIPSTSGAITLTNKTLAYTKVGRVVYVTGYLNVASVNNPVGNVTITGLPFACASHAAVSVMAYDLNATATTSIVGYTVSGSTQFNLYKYAGGVILSLAPEVKAASAFIVNLMYFTS